MGLLNIFSYSQSHYIQTLRRFAFKTSSPSDSISCSLVLSEITVFRYRSHSVTLDNLSIYHSMTAMRTSLDQTAVRSNRWPVTLLPIHALTHHQWVKGRDRNRHSVLVSSRNIHAQSICRLKTNTATSAKRLFAGYCIKNMLFNAKYPMNCTLTLLYTGIQLLTLPA